MGQPVQPFDDSAEEGYRRQGALASTYEAAHLPLVVQAHLLKHASCGNEAVHTVIMSFTRLLNVQQTGTGLLMCVSLSLSPSLSSHILVIHHQLQEGNHADKPDVFVWLDIFAVNQHPGKAQDDDLSKLQDVIKMSEKTLLVMDNDGQVCWWGWSIGGIAQLWQ